MITAFFLLINLLVLLPALSCVQWIVDPSIDRLLTLYLPSYAFLLVSASNVFLLLLNHNKKSDRKAVYTVVVVNLICFFAIAFVEVRAIISGNAHQYYTAFGIVYFVANGFGLFQAMIRKSSAGK